MAEPAKSTLEEHGDIPGAGHGRGRGIRILVVDDQRPFRETLRELIAVSPGFVLVGHACSGEEALVEVERLSPQLVLMDVTMPGMGGIEAARTIANTDPGILVVLISVDDPALDPRTADLTSTVVCSRKQDLRPNQLRRVWETHHG